jgi:hypothetical protein
MRIEKTMKTDTNRAENSFGQTITSFDDTEYTTVYGTLEEAMEYSKSHSCYLTRSTATEHLFPAWDKDAKYVVLISGKASAVANTLRDINGAGWYTHKFVIEEN